MFHFDWNLKRFIATLFIILIAWILLDIFKNQTIIQICILIWEVVFFIIINIIFRNEGE